MGHDATVRRPGWRGSVVAIAVLLAVLAAGCDRTSPPVPPALTGRCAWSAPSPDPADAASACGVAGTDLDAAIPRHADLLPVTVELFDDRRLTCSATGVCGVGDDRNPLTAPAAAPVVDPSRRRALLTLDWANDRARLHVSPRCHVSGPPDQPTQQCDTVSPSAIGFALTRGPGSAAPWHFRLDLALPADPGGAPVPATTDRWQLTLDPTDARMTLAGDGSGTPDFALTSQNSVDCAAPGAAPPRPPAPEGPQHYDCTLILPANP